MPPQAGLTHHAVLKFANGASYVGLMLPVPLPSGADAGLPWQAMPYNEFAPQIAEGNKTNRDFSVTFTRELNNDWSGGAEHYIESGVQRNVYANSEGGPALFTAREGRLLSAPRVVTVDAARKDLVQFILAPWNKYYARTRDTVSPGKVYEFNSTGTAVTAVETLTGPCYQLITDGTTLFAGQATSSPVRKTTDGAAWSNHTFNARHMAIRENGVLAYINGATFTPGGTEGFAAVIVGQSGTIATNMLAYGNGIYIFKPEGVWVWAAGVLTQILDAAEFVSTSNGKVATIHNGILYFNVLNALYAVTPSGQMRKIFPKDVNGFLSIDCLSATFGPLLIGASVSPKTSPTVLDKKAALYMMNGLADAGLNPLWSKQNTTVTSTAATSPGTLANDASAGTVAWTNPTNAASSNDVYATAVFATATTSQYLKATNFGFAIPAGAIISGIMVEVERSSTVASTISDTTVKLVKGGTISGESRAGGTLNPWPTTDAYKTHGDSTDLWGLSWTPADINASTFGVAIRCGGDPATAQIDHIRITVSYYVQDEWIGAGSTKLFDASATRVYACEANTNGLIYFDLTDQFQPNSHKTDADFTTAPYIDLTETTGQLGVVNKWYKDVIVSVKNPNSTTFLRIDYSTTSGTTWTQMVDHTGAVASLTLSAKEQGLFFPLNTFSTSIMLRIYKYTTTPSADAENIMITLRGIVLTKRRMRFTFPVLARSNVQVLSGPDELGSTIRTNLFAAADQFYPVDLQTPQGEWYRCVFQSSPSEQIESYTLPQYNAAAKPYSILMLNLVECESLSSTGARSAWTVG